MGAALVDAAVLELLRETPAEVRRQVVPWATRQAKTQAMADAIALGNDEAHADRLDLLEQVDALKEKCSEP